MNFIRARASAAMFFALAVSAHAEQVSVDFQSTIRPLTHAGSGFLHSFSATTPPDNLVVPLRPQLFRSYPESGDSGAFPTYDRVAAMGGKTQLVVSDAYGYNSPWPGDGGNWNAWEDLCRELVNHAMLEGKIIQYDLWNEPDIDSLLGQQQRAMARDVEARRAGDPDSRSDRHHRRAESVQLQQLRHPHARVSHVRAEQQRAAECNLMASVQRRRSPPKSRTCGRSRPPKALTSAASVSMRSSIRSMRRNPASCRGFLSRSSGMGSRAPPARVGSNRRVWTAASTRRSTDC